VRFGQNSFADLDFPDVCLLIQSNQIYCGAYSCAYGHAKYGQALPEIRNLNNSEAEIIQSRVYCQSCCMVQNVGQSTKCMDADAMPRTSGAYGDC